MTPSPITCPSCGEKVAYDKPACPSCTKPFPWSIEIEKVQEQLKERETNRIRATATLVQEAFEAAKGGKPISISAIKGFVTSWLFPRTVIILGSLLGGIVLVAQTYILWNQTRLLELQTRAAQLEQVVKIRDRLAVVSAHATALARLKTAYGTQLDLPPCESEACKSNRVRATLTGLREDLPTIPAPDAKVIWLALSAKLAAIARDADRIVRQPKVSIRESDVPNNLAVVTDLLRPAASYCLLDGAQSAALIERGNAFALLTANAHWISFPLEKPNEYVAFYKKFEQVKGNTTMGLIQYESAIEGMATAIKRPSSASLAKGERLDDSYTLGTYIEELKSLHAAMLSSLDAVIQACNLLSEQDKSALGAVSIPIRQ
jgi:hypothetical protein